jgi:hypothetical protein
MDIPIPIQFLHNLKESRNYAPKKCIAQLVGRLAPIFLAVESVEKRGARDPAGWSRVSVMCVAQEFSFLLDQDHSVSISTYSAHAVPFFFPFQLTFYNETTVT